MECQCVCSRDGARVCVYERALRCHPVATRYESALVLRRGLSLRVEACAHAALACVTADYLRWCVRLCELLAMFVRGMFVRVCVCDGVRVCACEHARCVTPSRRVVSFARALTGRGCAHALRAFVTVDHSRWSLRAAVLFAHGMRVYVRFRDGASVSCVRTHTRL